MRDDHHSTIFTERVNYELAQFLPINTSWRFDMSCAPLFSFSGLAAEAFSLGYTIHGDIDLEPSKFEDRLNLILNKHLGPDAKPTAQKGLLGKLHTADLYLAAGCAQSSERAWQRFIFVYEKYINDVARFASTTRDAAGELAANTLGDLYMPDRSGHSRIASFDGQQSLATWLRVIINRRAINNGLLKWKSFEHIDEFRDIVDAASVSRIEGAVQHGQYQSILNNCLRLVSESLTSHERLLVLLRYEEGLRVFEVARMLDIHPSRVSHQLQHVHVKLQEKINSLLAVEYHLSASAIDECVVDLLENPAHSLIDCLKESDVEDRASAVAAMCTH
jgi:RNA polymerase sigma factor (sigma-70 family)